MMNMLSTDGLPAATAPITIIDTPTMSDIPALSDQRTLQILYALHTTLDIKVIIQSFAKFLCQALDTSIRYSSSTAHIEVIIGANEAHRVQYKLANQDCDCGNILFSRNVAFSADEIRVIEDYLALLIMPLRNAIEHGNHQPKTPVTHA